MHDTLQPIADRPIPATDSSDRHASDVSAFLGALQRVILRLARATEDADNRAGADNDTLEEGNDICVL
jgi:hypothetical protein